ncbi:thiol reductant ABC exporter subunit CydD [Marinobacter adhaerens]|uniref:Thiol reductant ABC exporter subunit CydD n=1 Tax=Marinobacter adhaerens TaxID=1033846 RepID=A0A851HL82_9GAMM|nr:thiol reductant ABC exporter subunit CydD [Marinobacter piscensis]NWN90619.1 thiol reductant ABC exporter subunit CydD [Marinobacter adhaerens]
MTAPVPDQRSVRRWLSGLTRGNRHWIQGTVVAGTLAGVATIVQMGFLAKIVHLGVVEKEPASGLVPLFIGLIVAVIFRALAQGVQTHLAARCSEQVRHTARNQIHQHWRKSGPVILGQDSAGSLAREWIDHVDALHGYFARFLPQMVLSLIVPLLILILVFYLDWLAGIFLLLSAPLIPIFMALVGMGAEKLNQQHFEIISRLSGQFLDKVRGLTTLQLFGQTENAATVIQQRSDQYRRITLKTLRVAFLSSAVLEFFASVAIAVIAIYIGFGLLGYISYGPSPDLTLFSGLLILLLAPEFFQPLRTLSQHYHDRAEALGAGAEILARLSEESPRRPTRAACSQNGTQRTTNTIKLDAVSLAFRPEHSVLNKVSLDIAKGDIVALTGPSGGGKSTLLHLLAGFLVPDSGSIRIFGNPPGAAPFGWLGQGRFFVQGTWADNLRLTSPGVSDAVIEQALRIVGLGPLLDSRNEGIYSKVSEGGQGLSGGQARRLSLARIFVADYDLILLDEPTAGLDRESERIVLEALRELTRRGKTLIYSTHHQSLLALAKRHLVVRDGEVNDV